MSKRKEKSNESQKQSTSCECYLEEARLEKERFDRWNDDKERLFGINHDWEEAQDEGWLDRDVAIHVYRCKQCLSRHAIRFYPNGQKIDMDQAGDCHEAIVKQVQEN